jgi:uncharacterized membrane protein
MSRSWIALAFAWSAVVWALVIPVSALAAHHAETTAAPVKLFALASYQLGSLLCHQQPERSFSLSSVPLPVCARCTGIYTGAAAVAGIALLSGGVGSGRRTGSAAKGTGVGAADPVRTARIALAAAVVPAGSTLLYEWFTGRVPSNEIRAASGLLIGAVVAWVLVRLE